MKISTIINEFIHHPRLPRIGYDNLLQETMFMNFIKKITTVILLVLALSIAPFLHAQDQAPTAGTNASAAQTQNQTAPPIDEARLAQLLAPIALYPDPLLMQMFVASTYPLEIVEAARFIRNHSDLKDKALDQALETKKWDTSVKSLCHFPTVLESMNKNLEVTKELGDYFLQDQKAVLDMVQKLRAKAKETGNLKSTKEQKVVEEGKTIIIEPTKPDVIYVPSYSCSYVYGHWWYPSHPPYVWYPPPPAFRFVAGVVVGAALSHGWYHANWARGRVDVNVHRNINVNRTPRNGNRQAWKHNPRHRRGVAYNNPEIRKRYGQVDRATMKKNLASRGYNPRLDQNTRNNIRQQRAHRSGGGGTYNSAQRQQRTQQIKQRAQQKQRPVHRNGTRPSTGNVRRTQPQRSSSFNVSGSRSQAQRSSTRGSTSRNYSRSRSISRPRSGGVRRGGGRRR